MEFADCRLDIEGHELRRAGEVVDVEPQVFDVLAHLVLHRDRLVPKTELLDEVWGDRFVSESTLTSRIKSARRAIGDTGRDQRLIRTVHGRGYRFVADVTEEASTAASDAETAASPEGVVAVLTAGSGGAWEVEAPHGRARVVVLERIHRQADQHDVLVGRGSSAGDGMRLFGCVVDAVDEIVGRERDLLDELPHGVRVELERALRGELPATRQRMFLAVRELLARAADRRPTLLLLDDLEFADADTIELVRHVARLAVTMPVGVVAAHTPGSLGLSGFVELPTDGRDVTGDDDGPTAIPPEIARPLAAVSLGGPSFDLLQFRAATALDDAAGDRVLDVALEMGVIEPVPGGGFRFTDDDLADRLAAELPPHRRAAVHRGTAERLRERGAAAGRVARHLLAAGSHAEAVPVVLEAAARASEAQLHREAIRLTGEVVDHATGRDRLQLLMIRGQSLVATGDPSAVAVFRQALTLAPPEKVPLLRAGLARAAMLSGDLGTAGDALRDLEPDGGPGDGPLLLAQGMYAFFRGDMQAARDAADAARDAAFEAGTSDRMLDVITLQGMIAHNEGEWFDRLRSELRVSEGNAALAATIFDCHLCVAEYLLYGPTPYEDVVAMATRLRTSAEQSGAARAVAFSWCVSGEAELLAGNLETAREHLEHAVRLHRELAADSGTAHSLQRLAEVELASGNRQLAQRLAREALPLARWSTLARHLVQRTYGTLIHAAASGEEALAVVDEAQQTLDDPSSCPFCQVMVAVPTAIACAEGGRLADARVSLAQAEASASLWQGTAWQGAVAEARAVIARAEAREDEAAAQFALAARLFEQAGQPMDVERCREEIEIVV